MREPGPGSDERFGGGHAAPTRRTQPADRLRRRGRDLPVGPDAKRLRRNAATRLLAIHPRPAEWMTRPTPARLADLARTGAWSFLAWCAPL
jgi:hypothetical protein